MGVTHVPFYPSDWLAGTRGLSAVETGIYITLIAMMYERGGAIADDRDRLARLCGASKAQFVKSLNWLISERMIVCRDGHLSLPSNRPVRASLERRAPSGWQETRLRIFSRDGFICTYCGDADGPFACDHIYPVSLGGSDDDGNLTTACRSCNSMKGAKTIEEWLR